MIKEEKAYAKINLSLDITGKRADGYHLLETVMQSVSLYDTVRVEKGPEITVSCSDPRVPPEKNIARKAAGAFFAAAGISGGARIYIEKRIPMEAGMAGGSTDAAAVLRALNSLYGGKFSLRELCAIGAGVGADVPFCVRGGTCLAKGIGEILTPLPPMMDCSIVVVKPPEGISTAEAYRKIDESGLSLSGTAQVVEALKAGDLEALGKSCSNVFELAIPLKSRERIKKAMKQSGALGACMTGSGSAVYGLFARQEEARACARVLSGEFEQVYELKPVPQE